MNLGIYSSEIQRSSVGELFEAIAGCGFSETVFGFSSAGEEPMPERIDPELVASIHERATANDVEIVAVGGTYNMSHPDPAVRAEGARRLEVIAEACQGLDCDFITLCTGTRNRDSMWRWHDDNLTPAAWQDMLVSMEKALDAAERYDLLLGIETEASNVVNTPERARQLLDAFQSPRLKIIMDVANLFQEGEAQPENVRPIMDNAFDLLGEDVGMAHGKDIKAGDGLDFTRAGNGIVDFDYFIEKLQSHGYSRGMILHGIKGERYIPESAAFMRRIIAGHVG